MDSSTRTYIRSTITEFNERMNDIRTTTSTGGSVKNLMGLILQLLNSNVHHVVQVVCTVRPTAKLAFTMNAFASASTPTSKNLCNTLSDILYESLSYLYADAGEVNPAFGMFISILFIIADVYNLMESQYTPTTMTEFNQMMHYYEKAFNDLTSALQMII